mgnify:CR=1 FL=1
MDLCFFKLRHSHKSNFQITTTQIPLKKQRKNQIPLWWVHEPSLRVYMKRWGGYMSFAVGVYETGLYVENVHPNKWIWNEFLQSENEIIQENFLTNTSQSKLFIFFDLATQDFQMLENLWWRRSIIGNVRLRLRRSLALTLKKVLRWWERFSKRRYITKRVIKRTSPPNRLMNRMYYKSKATAWKTGDGSIFICLHEILDVR